VLPMQAGPAQDTSETVGYQVGERTLLSCFVPARGAPVRPCAARTARPRGCRGLPRDAYTGAGSVLPGPWTSPAICTAPLVRAKGSSLGEGVSESDARELASAVRGKHEAAVETLLRVNMADGTAAPMAAFTVAGDAGDRLDALE